MKIPNIVNTVFLLIVCIFGFVFLAPFIIAKDTSSIAISSALIGSAFIVIIYASNHIEKKTTEMEKKVNELEDKRKELEYLVGRNSKIESMISSLIKMFLDPKDIDKTIEITLETAATLCNAEKSYLFIFNKNGEAYRSHQWKKENINASQSFFEKVDHPQYIKMLNKLRKDQLVFIQKEGVNHKMVNIDRISTSPTGLVSLIAIPVESNGELAGFISIESENTDIIYYEVYPQTIKIVSELVSMALNHKSFLKELSLFKDLINRSNDFILVIDMEKNNIIDVNETACKELGYKRDEFLGMKKDQIHSLFNDNFWEHEFRDIFGDRYFEPSKIITRKDGSTLQAEINVTFSSIDNNKYALAIVRDVTERKDMESILAKTKEVMELALEGADLGMWDWNLRTNEVMYNPRWAEMMGYEYDRVEHNIDTWKNITHPDDIKFVNENIHRHLQGETPFFESEFRVRNNNGKWQWILARGKLTELDKNNEPFRFTGTTMDLDKRKKVEEELRHSNEMKDLFTDIMRHDLLNPAGNAKGYSEVLLEMEEEPGKSHIIQSMQKNINKLIDMIETAATFAKLDSLEELQLVRMDIMSIMNNVTEQFDQRLMSKNMTIEMRANNSYHAMLNPIAEEIFANFISNAIKYSPENTRIIIDIQDCNYEWKVNVTDFGEGIPDESKPLVFDRFKRVNKSGVKGSGLGLAIVKKIAELLGGVVGVEDNPEGTGSRFWFRIKKDQSDNEEIIFENTDMEIIAEKNAHFQIKC
ncbi:MAG: PAS domain S-box protein [Methanolobus sp.]|nr:PAS domain S-box protein [Methanolobus sp.]